MVGEHRNEHGEGMPLDQLTDRDIIRLIAEWNRDRADKVKQLGMEEHALRAEYIKDVMVPKIRDRAKGEKHSGDLTEDEITVDMFMEWLNDWRGSVSAT